MIKIIFITSFLLTINLYAQWVDANSPANLACGNVVKKGSYIFVGSDGKGVFRSSDNGDSWESVNNGLGSLNSTVRLFSTDNYLFVVHQYGGYAIIYRSNNSGDSWEACTVPYYYYIIGVGVYNNTIWVGYYTSNRVYKSTDDGTTWTLTTLPYLDYIAFDSNNLYCTAGYGFWRSSDGGNNWESALSNGFPSEKYDLIANDEYIFACTFNGASGNSGRVYRSSDNGDNWTVVNNGLSVTSSKRDLLLKNNILYVVCEGEGIYSSTDYGDNWSIFSNESQTPGVTWIEMTDNTFFANSLTGYGVYRSSIENANWITINNGFPKANVTFFHSKSNILFAGSGVDGLFRTTNYGATWTRLGFSNSWISITSIGNLIFLGNYNAGVYRSGDDGSNWYFLDDGLTNKNIFTIGSNQENLYVGTWYLGPPYPAAGIFKSTDFGSNWFNIGLLSGRIVSIAFKGNNIFASDYGTGIFRSSDEGTNWTPINNGLASTLSIVLAANNTYLFAGTFDGGIFRSDDDGNTWVQKNVGLPNAQIYDIKFYESDIYISTTEGVFKSIDNGENWIDISTGLTDRNSQSLGLIDSYLFAGTTSKGVWKYTTPLPVELTSFSIRLNNNDVNLKWETATEVNNYGFEIERKTEGNWQKLGFVNGNGNSNSPKQYSYKDNNPIGGNKFQYRLKQIDNDGQFEYSDIVEVEMAPNEYVLYQNYPNPFNPVTKVRFAILVAGRVSMKLYNAVGEEVKEIINQDYDAGYHEVEINGGELASGIYLYKIVSSNFTAVKKLIIMK